MRDKHISGVSAVATALMAAALCHAARAETPELTRSISLKRQLVVPRAESAPTIDGGLDDACWSRSMTRWSSRTIPSSCSLTPPGGVRSFPGPRRRTTRIP